MKTGPGVGLTALDKDPFRRLNPAKVVVTLAETMHALDDGAVEVVAKPIRRIDRYRSLRLCEI